ncbi:proteasome assembly chaperone family protein [Halobaculum sp. CBA1158]|uniref:proteasome assembly chaperone family protein n=1 Tax=Halobaculum sp. CBA1158 TaxID=2904243 RepID=UPI001F1FF6F7|nr:proteasome assembly chaperone family protein [Halobaculum sp. CBA1158]UIP00810.1 proteasome assembly chaperone family protein [Halobaculum sp. CBA1158]
MDDIDIETVADPDLEDPVFIEGLPGVGHVGKLVAEHLLEEFDGDLVRRVYTTEFPPQVTVDDEGAAELTHAQFHHVDADGRDLLVLTGDHQAASNQGHYTLTTAFLDVAEEFGCERAFALGGVPTGELIEDDEYDVLGALTDAADRDEYEDAGVEFRADEPAGGIVGVSGLVLGLGSRRGLPAACLMGETSGYLVDPKSAQAVLEVLQSLLDIEVDFSELEERAEEMEEVVGKIQEMQGSGGGGMPSEDELRYIG